MFIFYHCPNPDCGFDAHVKGQRKEIDILIRQNHVCPYCEELLEHSMVFRGRDKHMIRNLAFSEFYGAVNGLGFPSETVTHLEPVVAMLLAHRIVDVDAEEVSERCIVHSVTLDNGVTLHMAASGYGAAVYKATRRRRDASPGTKRSLHEQYLRGPSSPEKHGPRGHRDADPGGEVHRRVRQDADASGGDDRGEPVPPPPGHQREGEGGSEMVRQADPGEAERASSANAQGAQDAQEGPGTAGG